LPVSSVALKKKEGINGGGLEEKTSVPHGAPKHPRFDSTDIRWPLNGLITTETGVAVVDLRQIDPTKRGGSPDKNLRMHQEPPINQMAMAMAYLCVQCEARDSMFVMRDKG